MAEETRHQLAFLDGLRGFASLWVLVGHAMFLTGYKVMILAEPDLAVELFIIISGFLMTGIIVSRCVSSYRGCNADSFTEMPGLVRMSSLFAASAMAEMALS